MIIYTNKKIKLFEHIKLEKELFAKTRKELNEIFERNEFYLRAIHTLQEKSAKKLKR